jgi:hypothetical protein
MTYRPSVADSALTDGASEGGQNEAPDPFGAAGPEADRDQSTGRFVRGNRAALVHGARSTAFWAAVAAEQQARRTALLADKGYHNGDAPEALAAIVDGACQALVLRDASFNRILEAGGPTSLHGRRRAIFRTWLEASDRARDHLRLLGLERQERPVDPMERVRRAVEEANRS